MSTTATPLETRTLSPKPPDEFGLGAGSRAIRPRNYQYNSLGFLITSLRYYKHVAYSCML